MIYLVDGLGRASLYLSGRIIAVEAPSGVYPLENSMISEAEHNNIYELMRPDQNSSYAAWGNQIEAQYLLELINQETKGVYLVYDQIDWSFWKERVETGKVGLALGLGSIILVPSHENALFACQAYNRVLTQDSAAHHPQRTLFLKSGNLGYEFNPTTPLSSSHAYFVRNAADLLLPEVIHLIWCAFNGLTVYLTYSGSLEEKSWFNHLSQLSRGMIKHMEVHAPDHKEPSLVQVT